MPFSLKSIRVDNLRGYSDATLNVESQTTLIVGSNNSGKTSILRLLDWLLNGMDDTLLTGNVTIPKEVLEFLLPATDTHKRARRLTLGVGVADGRSHRRYSCVEGLALLRLNLRISHPARLYLALGNPKRSESAKSSDMAIELLNKIRETIHLIYVPSFRDAASPRFQDTILKSFKERLAERAIHSYQGGARLESRKVKKALEDLTRVATKLVDPLWDEMEKYLPSGLATSAHAELNCSKEMLVDWLSEHLTLKVATGTHDRNGVIMTQLGSGLQSLLDQAIQRTSGYAKDTTKQTIVIFEEPEAFLHPSAQRAVARSLMSQDVDSKTIITTHSPIIAEEATFGDIVICKDQRFFHPSVQNDTQRNAINTALQCGHGAEMMFSSSVLFVEGEGDRLFFEQLRRRIALSDKSGCADELYVVPVGGKQCFTPWMKLLQSYGHSKDRPMKWMVVADGDAASDIVKAFRDTSINLPSEIHRSISNLVSERKHSPARWATAVGQLNQIIRRYDFSFALLPVDLEYAFLECASPNTIRSICSRAGCSTVDKVALLKHLGSKSYTHANKKHKSPWIRGHIGETIPWSELSGELIYILRRWLTGTMTSRQAGTLLGSIK